MATLTEGKVLRLLADELEQIPLQPKRRPIMENIIAALREMSVYGTFETGRYRSLDDVMEILGFYGASRVRGGGRGRPVLPEIEVEPGYVRETLARTHSEREKYQKPINEKPNRRYEDRNRKINAALKAKRKK